MGIFQKHNVIKVDGKATPKWLKAKLCQSQNYRKSWYVWDILNTCIWIFNIENKCHSIFMKTLLVLNAAHLLLIAMVYTLYFLSILTPAEHSSNCNVWQEVMDFFILSYFSYILCFQRLAQSIPVSTRQLMHFVANIFKCKQYLLVCTVQDEYGASLCHLKWLSSEASGLGSAFNALRTQGWIF